MLSSESGMSLELGLEYCPLWGGVRGSVVSNPMSQGSLLAAGEAKVFLPAHLHPLQAIPLLIPATPFRRVT